MNLNLMNENEKIETVRDLVYSPFDESNTNTLFDIMMSIKKQEIVLMGYIWDSFEKNKEYYMPRLKAFCLRNRTKFFNKGHLEAFYVATTDELWVYDYILGAGEISIEKETIYLKYFKILEREDSYNITRKILDIFSSTKTREQKYIQVYDFMLKCLTSEIHTKFNKEV